MYRDHAIEVKNVSYHYHSGGTAVVANDAVSFGVPRGEIFGLLGPNGAGKTTLISQLLGLLTPTAGSICVEGIDVIRQPQAVKQMTGYLPQTGMAMRNIEVEQALYFTGRLRGQSASDARQQARSLIDQLGLGSDRRRYVSNLSGGMMRLVNFAMALMGRAQVLVLDEPTNELDPHNRHLVWAMIQRLNQTQGVTCILVTHHVLEAERILQRVAVMRRGRILALGTPGELVAHWRGRARLEFRLKDSAEPFDLAALEAFGELQTPTPSSYQLYLPETQVAAATDFLMTRIGLANLNDFRLNPPTLEDIYLELNHPALEVAHG